MRQTKKGGPEASFKSLGSRRWHVEKLAELIEGRAAQLVEVEAKTRAEAAYLAICSIVDALKKTAATTRPGAVPHHADGHLIRRPL